MGVEHWTPGMGVVEQGVEDPTFNREYREVVMPGIDEFAERLWQVFLSTHPRYVKTEKNPDHTQTCTPLLSLEEALGRDGEEDFVSDAGVEIPLSVVAQQICERAHASALLVGSVLPSREYSRWLGSNKDALQDNGLESERLAAETWREERKLATPDDIELRQQLAA